MIDGRPDLLVLGAGHSGTTIVTQLLGALGWRIPDADERYGEHQAIRQLNREHLATGSLPGRARAVVHALRTEQPWVVKDPRFVVTLSDWAPLFAEAGPVMPTVLWIERRLADMEESYRRRGESWQGEPGTRWVGAHVGYSALEMQRMAAEQAGRWPGPVVRLRYEEIAQACALFRAGST